MPDKFEYATFGAGCFWCVEAVFQRLKGVISVESGYAGGHVESPTYEQVCSGKTGHAEVCRIKFNPDEISYPDLLEVFWKSHDPTALNRQGNDVGPQYRSVIFYHNNEQKKIAEQSKKLLNNSDLFENEIVTEISPLTNYFPAEKYHQNYFNNNQAQPYCSFIIKPKVDKIKKLFAERLV